MAVLMAIQFDSSPRAWVNLGVAGHRGQIFAAPGRIRPAGTFSFVNGPIGFFSIALAALIAGSVERGVVLAAAHRRMGRPFRSRRPSPAAAAFWRRSPGVMLVGVAGWARGRSSKLGSGLVVSAFTALVAVNVLGSFDTVREGAEVIQSRLDQWGNGGLGRRLMYDYDTIKWAIVDSPMLGVGLGAGTNAGAAMQGTKGFRWGEGEWPRVIFEAGPILGLLYLIWRVWITLAVGRAALRVSGSGALLPLLLWGACASSLLSGQWGQTSIQGFGVFTLGLTLAAGRTAFRQRTAVPVAEPAPAWVRRRRPPGRASRMSGARPLRVVLVSNYVADEQRSMQRFADMLQHELTAGRRRRRRRGALRRVSAGARRRSGLGKWLGYIDKFVLYPPRLRNGARRTPARRPSFTCAITRTRCTCRGSAGSRTW